MGDSGVRGSATFEEIPEGVQVVLEVSNLPKAGKPYYAQVHEGACSELREGHEHGGTGIAVALVRLDRILAKVPWYTHGGREGPTANELPGNLDQPIEAISSADCTASVSTLLDGVEVEEIFAGKPEYLDLHPSGSEDPPTLGLRRRQAERQLTQEEVVFNNTMDGRTLIW